MKGQTIIFWILLLIIADQAIKVIIYSHYLDCRFEIIPSLLEFKPYFNDKHSYVNVLLNKQFQINVGLWPHIILILILEIIVLNLYASFKINLNNTNTKLLDVAIIFQIAGFFCALIGNLIWQKGTLDYIFLKPLFIFDLKDIYSNCFLVLFFVFFYKNLAQLKTIDMMRIKDIILYVKNWLKVDE